MGHVPISPFLLFIKTLASGVDFLGWVHFPHHTTLRSVTKRRIFRRIYESPKNEVLQSYVGLLSHGNAFGLKQALLNNYYLWAGKGESTEGLQEKADRL